MEFVRAVSTYVHIPVHVKVFVEFFAEFLIFVLQLTTPKFR